MKLDKDKINEDFFLHTHINSAILRGNAKKKDFRRQNKEIPQPFTNY